ncbi:MAG TPA: hypothetical protein DCM07_22415 [Planctomycetaceae bacterium]|nr:hypothetical protein [Gimesia sp.]MBP71941.1 hypothetical protein [Haliea sp.]HAH47564.1 hypothetical protein [Planctomycetaceae bacterium]HBL44812.1 hypothetical protein [Planctomycetaceae bacterium]
MKTLQWNSVVPGELSVRGKIDLPRNEWWGLKQTPPELDLHLIVDNYAIHKHPKVQNWLKRHKRFYIHFTPTSSLWLNVIERWFRDITQDRIRNGVFKSVSQLEQAI